MTRWSLALVCAAVAAGCGGSSAPLATPDTREPVVVGAAVSLAETVGTVVERFEAKAHERVEVTLGASNTLATQIVAGAPIDLFISADPQQMDRVEAARGLEPGSRVNLLSNRLVLVVPRGSGGSIDDVRDLVRGPLARIAIGDPERVPAGVYARAFLTAQGVWDELRDRLIPAISVRAALALIETGSVDAGFVYRTDARLSETTEIAFEVPVGTGPPIVYPAAVVSGARYAERARRLLEYLESDEAARVFEEAGFVALR